MNQEDLNSIMKFPWETSNSLLSHKCPVCGERYYGNGVYPCVDCESLDSNEDSNTPVERYVSDKFMTLNELFLLVQRAKRAAQKSGLQGRGSDLRLSNEVRMVALDLDERKYDKALDLIKSLCR